MTEHSFILTPQNLQCQVSFEHFLHKSQLKIWVQGKNSIIWTAENVEQLFLPYECLTNAGMLSL